MVVGLVLAVCAATVADAHAQAQTQTQTQTQGGRRPIVGYQMRGDTKTTDDTAEYLSRTSPGELVGPADIARLEQAFLSSELFKTVVVTLEDAPGGVIVVATVDDKHSWIIAPTVFALPNRKSFGVGFAENNFRGKNEKLLLYGQYGDRESLFFGVWVVPSIAGTPLTFRVDSYLYQRFIQEYANPPDDPTSQEVARETENTYFGGGLLLGWRFAWWASADLRLRGAYVQFRNAHDGEDPDVPLPLPQTDGWDVSAQARLTFDGRHSRFGVTWGPYLQLHVDTTIPGLDDYDYSIALLRAWYSWRLFEEHQFEVRTSFQVGRRLPFHEELVLGGAGDLRGYAVDRFRGDTRAFARAEYSVPLAKWKFFAFRAIGFWDSGYLGWNFERPGGDRDYLPFQGNGHARLRNDVGIGLRVYVKAIVLPLLGLDIAYGIEGERPEVYFELGITDF